MQGKGKDASRRNQLFQRKTISRIICACQFPRRLFKKTKSFTTLFAGMEIDLGVDQETGGEICHRWFIRIRRAAQSFLALPDLASQPGLDGNRVHLFD
jgi:hypothetical protein